jgi:hypothetical protein
LGIQYLAQKKGLAGSSGATYQAWPGS